MHIFPKYIIQVPTCYISEKRMIKDNVVFQFYI